MDIKIIKSVKTSQWSGGETTELIISPENSDYQKRQFEYRVSTATISVEQSEFTKLEGVERYITSLSQAFEIEVNGKRQIVEKGKVIRFSGEDKVLSKGKAKDLNLMLKGKKGQMEFIKAEETKKIDNCSHIILYIVDKVDKIQINNHNFAFLEDRCISIQNNKKESVVIKADKGLIVISIY